MFLDPEGVYHLYYQCKIAVVELAGRKLTGVIQIIRQTL